MSKELTVPHNWTQKQMDLITNVIAKNATPEELDFFLYRCEKMELDPFKPGQIYFIKFGNNPGTIVIGIEGFRSRAGRTGKLSGIKRGTIKDGKGLLVGAWAEVYRSDWRECAREEVSLKEYNTGKAMWAKMPETMIKKVAEAAALRMAFPDDLGGIYAEEEIDHPDISHEGEDSKPPQTIVIPKETPPKEALPTRETLKKEIVAAANKLCLSKEELAEWAQNKTGLPSFINFTVPQLVAFRNELYTEMKGK